MGILDWKMVVTAIILLGIVAVVLSTNPVVSDFFDKIMERFTGFVPAQEFGRNISFELSADDYIDLEFKKQNINLLIDSDKFYAELGSGEIDTSNNVSVTGTSISGYVKGKTVFFEGDFSRIKVAGTSISFNAGTIKANSTFNSLIIENLVLDRIDLSEASGTIIMDDTITTLAYKEVNITHPLATFNFGSQMHIDGIAEKLVSENLVIGP